jgi:hypothetical protein
MRAAFVSLALAACATASAPDSVPAAVRGCWIERRADETLTMRWFPTNEGPLQWRGALNSYKPGEETSLQTFRIDPTAGEREQFGWALCPEGEPHGPPCQPLFFQPSHGEDEAFELIASEAHLRFAYRNGEDRLVLFEGARDGCD